MCVIIVVFETETEEQGVRQKLDSTPKASPVNRGNLRSREPYSFMCGVAKLEWLEVRIHRHQDERRSDVSAKGVILAKHAKPLAIAKAGFRSFPSKRHELFGSIGIIIL